MSGLGIWNVKDSCGGGILEARWILFFLPLIFLPLQSHSPIPLTCIHFWMIQEYCDMDLLELHLILWLRS